MDCGPEVHAVTGAYGYSGSYIAHRLLEAGHKVVTLTNSPPRPDVFDGTVRAFPLCFDRPDDLARSLDGVAVLHNTYWVRFNHRDFTFARAVRNSLALFEAARRAGVGRIVHVSITNPSGDSRLEYFRGKARLERALRESPVGCSILRPAVLFGGDDILVNNIAWALRHLPLFGVFGDGDYRLQPIHVNDLARLAVEHAALSGDVTVQAIGPETFTYRGLVEELARILGRPRRVVSVPPILGWAAGKILGLLLGDVLITRDEIRGLMEERLYVDAPPAGTTRLTGWAARHCDTLGKRYQSEMARRGR